MRKALSFFALAVLSLGLGVDVGRAKAPPLPQRVVETAVEAETGRRWTVVSFSRGSTISVQGSMAPDAADPKGK